MKFNFLNRKIETTEDKIIITMKDIEVTYYKRWLYRWGTRWDLFVCCTAPYWWLDRRS